MPPAQRNRHSTHSTPITRKAIAPSTAKRVPAAAMNAPQSEVPNVVPRLAAVR